MSGHVCILKGNTAVIDTSGMTVPEIVGKSGLRHIAFIMDGNGRWAKERGQIREFGHRAGADTFRTVAKYCRSVGIECVTVYAFSTENVKRPQREVEAIFNLLFKYIEEAYLEEDVEFRFIGEPGELSPKIGQRTRELEEKTAGRRFRLNIAFNYGGRAEIVNAVNRLIKEGKTEITEEDISSSVYTKGCPDPDMIVRTGNEERISNFLLWQCAYSELYYSEKMWPDFTTEDVDAAIREFARRSRRWGGLDGNK